MLIKEYRNPDWGRAFTRISNAFRKYSPDWLEWTNGKYDLKLVHVVGGEELEWLKEDIEKTIIVQHCYFTTNFLGWDEYWKNALLTISFHNLPDYTSYKFNFLRMPWGAEPSTLYYTGVPKTKELFVTGHVAETESIDKIYEVMRQLKKPFYHTGHDFKYDKTIYKYLPYMDDFSFRILLSETKRVAGLRLIEGFEMACVEGMFCKARPIVFDLPTYDFYKGFAEFVDPNFDIVEQLVEILKKEPQPISDGEYAKILETFSWDRIMSRFYAKLKEVIN